MMFLLFVAIIVGVYAVGAFLRRGRAIAGAVLEDLSRRRALEDLYRERSFNVLGNVAGVLEGKVNQPLSARLEAASQDIMRRRRVAKAMETELGVM